MDTVIQWFTQAVTFFKANPEICALSMAVVFSWAFALWAERVIYNPGLSKLQRQRASTGITTFACFGFGVLMWQALAAKNHDSRLFEMGCCLGMAILSPFLYIIATRLLGNKFPWLKSVFSELDEDEPHPPAPVAKP